MSEQEKKDGFLDKVKEFFAKLGKGTKDVAVKTARRNSPKFIGNVFGVGNLNVESDHALIYAINMDDIVFKADNVVRAGYVGCFGPSIKVGKSTIPTVKYDMVLDDKVVYPETLKADTSVLRVELLITKDKEHYHGKASYTNSKKEFKEGTLYVYPDVSVFVWTRITNPDNGMNTLETIVLPHSQLQSAHLDSPQKFTYITGESVSFSSSNPSKLQAIDAIVSKA